MKWPSLVRGGNIVQNNRVDQSNVPDINSVIYSAGTNQLSFYMNVRGSSNKTYSVQISFKNVDEVEVESKEEAEKYLQNGRYMLVKDGSGNNHIVERPVLSKNDVQVRCDCPSFRFTYAFYDRAVSAMFGRNFQVYHRKTNTRPPRNPEGMPGVCKHLIIAMEALVGSDFVIA